MFTGRIRIYPTSTGWVANYDQTREVEQVRALFGFQKSDPVTLPTPFTVECDAATVVRELTRLNPGATIHADV